MSEAAEAKPAPARWCLPVVQGRGSGLGNEMIAWARAYLMSREIGARCLAPAFGRNPRGYGRHFGTPRLDWLTHRLMVRALPCVRFDEADFVAHGGGDVSRAFARFARARGLHGRAPLVVATSGMWGGYAHVDRAAAFVRATLCSSRFARDNLGELGARLQPRKLTVAMHVRLGDFSGQHAAPEAYLNQFNVSLPLDWFVGIGRQLRDRLGDAVQFQVFSDGPAERLAPLNEVIKPVSTATRLPADVSDLVALSQADLLVCSVSSYSLWAAALSDAPYLWFEPQLHRHAGALRSIWGHEAGQQAAGSPTRLAFEAWREPTRPAGRRAFAVGMGKCLPDTLIDELLERQAGRNGASDLVRYGVAEAIA